MKAYDIRLYRADATLSIIMKTFANEPLDAQAQASAMLKGEIVRAEIWCDHQHVETLQTTDRVISKYAPRDGAKPPARDGADGSQ